MIAAIVGAVALVVFPYDFRQATINSLLGVLICLSLVVIVGFVGQISVVQLALAGVAGFTMSHLTTDLGGVWASFPISLLIGATTATLVGLVIAVSALRVRGVSLVVVTLAAAVALEQFGFLNERWGGQATGSPVKQPELGGLDLSPDASFRGLDDKIPSPVFGFLVLAAVILLGLLVANVRRASLGQRMLAVRSNERAAAAAGINVRNTKLTGFGIAAFVAGMAGALYAYNFGSVSYSRFGALAALALIAFTYFGGITMVSGAIIAGIGATEGLLPHTFDRGLGLSGNWAFLIGGIALIVTLLVNPEGIAGTGYKKKQQKKKRLAAEAAAETQTADRAPAPSPMPTGAVLRRKPTPQEHATTVLSATGISVSFGGLRALDDVDLKVEEGQLVGLIGPNGAGKTTFIDAISGFVPCEGQVELDGQALDRMPAHARARRGLARTWQSIELFDDLSVKENMAVASYRPSAWATIKESLSRPVTSTEAADAALELLGLESAADAMPEDLSQGQRKLVGIARALAAEPRLLCLDEPAAGLDAREGEELARHLRGVVDAGTSMLLVDHDMGLVLGISDYVVVLEFGRVIAQGTPDVVRRRSAGDQGVSRERRGRARACGRRTVSDARLTIEGLTAGYEGAAVIRGLDITVGQGEVVALLGANGAGKTTTLRVVSGLVRPMSGSVTFDGRDLARVSPTQRARLGIAHVPEGRGIFYGLTVTEHFRLGFEGKRPDEQAAYEYFPKLAGAAHPARRAALGRRAADARNRPRARLPAPAAPPRRALAGARAGHRRGPATGRAQVRDRLGLRRAARGAAHPARARDRQPGVRALPRRDRPLGPRGGSAGRPRAPDLQLPRRAAGLRRRGECAAQPELCELKWRSTRLVASPTPVRGGTRWPDSRS